MFITFEGIDGSGKSTQLELLAKDLQQKGRKVLLTREPGGTPFAEGLRQILLEASVMPAAELLLFGAARAQHIAEVIQPALADGAIVLCDRFTDSSLAYQGGGLGLPADFIDRMNDFACQEVSPDLTLLFDVDPLAGLKRQQLNQQKPDAIESRGLEFLERVRQAYLTIAHAHPERMVIINAGRDMYAVQCDVTLALQQRGLL